MVVQTTSGTYRGEQSETDGTDRWLGIRYAQPPVGSLRFKAPVSYINDSTDIVDAFEFGNACPQVPSASLGAPIGEDCLHLNVNPSEGFIWFFIYSRWNFFQVWRPINTTADSKLPVLFWIHVRSSIHTSEMGVLSIIRAASWCQGKGLAKTSTKFWDAFFVIVLPLTKNMIPHVCSLHSSEDMALTYLSFN